jgi:prolyl oligopeptidase
MTTSTQQAVGMDPNPRIPPLYPVVVDMGGSHGAAAEGEDSLRWLENPDTPAVKQWIEAQNKLSRAKLAALPLAGRLQARAAQIAAQREPLPPALQTDRAVSPAGFVARRSAEAWEVVRPDGQVLPDKVRATSVAWGSTGLYYSTDGHDGHAVGVYLHRPGETGHDSLIYAPADPALSPEVQVTGDGHYLVITLKDGTERSGIQLLDLRQPQGKPVTLFTATDALHSFIGSSSDRLYFLTTRNAPRGRIVAVSSREPLGGTAAVVPESPGRLEHAAYAGGRVLTATLEDGRSFVRLYSPDGKAEGEVALPGTGHVLGLGGQSEAFLIYTDYLTPPTAYRIDPAGGRLARWSSAPPAIDTAAYVTDRLVVPGQDSASVLVYVTHRRDRARDGDQPLALQASAQLVPSFNPEVLAWLELGGAYAEVSVRPERRAGQVRSGLDDLQAAADHLVRERYTRTRRLGIYGHGTSALAVAAALAQRPDSYGAAVSQLTADAGDETRPALDTFAPYRHVKKGLCYPPTLVTTLDRDSPVVPSEGYLLVAHLQAVQLCSNPVLIRVDPRAGTGNRAEVSAQQWAFLAEWLGLTPSS